MQQLQWRQYRNSLGSSWMMSKLHGANRRAGSSWSSNRYLKALSKGWSMEFPTSEGIESWIWLTQVGHPLADHGKCCHNAARLDRSLRGLTPVAPYRTLSHSQFVIVAEFRQRKAVCIQNLILSSERICRRDSLSHGRRESVTEAATRSRMSLYFLLLCRLFCSKIKNAFFQLAIIPASRTISAESIGFFQADTNWKYNFFGASCPNK